MAALVNTCWKNGVWADPVWAVGVWASAGSPPVVVTPTNPTIKQGGWHGGVIDRMKAHRKREATLEQERDAIYRKLVGETQQAYVEVRKERKTLPDRLLAPIKQAVSPYSQRTGIPQAKDIDWAKLVVKGLDDAVSALSQALEKQGREKAAEQQRNFELAINHLMDQLDMVEKEQARVRRAMDDLDDEYAIELILQQLED